MVQKTLKNGTVIFNKILSFATSESTLNLIKAAAAFAAFAGAIEEFRKSRKRSSIGFKRPMAK